jgi:hypothetical protein
MSKRLRQVLFVVLVVLAVALLLHVGGIVNLMNVMQDDDRPPIIVSSGSINIEPQEATKGGRGTLESGNRRRWHHFHSNGQPASLTFRADNSATCQSAIDDVGLVTVGYTDGTTSRTFRIRLARRYMVLRNVRLDFDEDVTAVDDAHMRLADGDGKTYAITSVDVTTSGGTTYTCGAVSQFVVRQPR